MASRRTSLSDYADLAIAREIDSKYDDVRIVADNIEAIQLCTINIDNIVNIYNIKDLLTIVADMQLEVKTVASATNAIDYIINNIDVLYSIDSNITAINSVFNDKAVLDSIFNDKLILDTLHTNLDYLNSVYANLIAIVGVYTNMSSINSVNRKLTNITTVSNNIPKIVAVANSIYEVNTVANNIPAITHIIPNIPSIYSIGASIDSIVSVANNIGKISSVNSDLANITTVADSITDISTTSTNMSSIISVAANTDDIITVSDGITNVNVVALNITNVSEVSSNIVAVTDVVTNISDINKVANNLLDISTVSNNNANIVTSATNIDAINEVASIVPDILTVVSNTTNINAVVTNIDGVISISEQIVPNLPEILAVNELASQVSVDTSDVAIMKLAVESLYNSFDNKFLGSKISDPLVDNDGNPLLDGALYFNTSNNTLRVYDKGNSVWLVIPQLYLSSLLDVELVSISSGDVLVWDGSRWNNTNLQATISTNSEVLANTNARHTHSNKLLLDVIDQKLDVLGTPKFSSVQLNGGTGDQGLFSWDTNNETSILDMGNYIYPLGQALPLHCTKYNGTGNIAKGKPVIAMGTTGNSGKILVAEATLANWQLKDPSATEVPAKYVLGVTAEAITNNGVVICFGKVENITGASYTQGTVYYVDEINGGFTSIRPTNGLVMPMAFAINNNTLMVRVTPINELAIDKGVIGYNHSISMGTYSDFNTAFIAAEAN